MKLILLAGLLCSTAALADEYVQGYMRHDGTYVQPHHRSDPNQYRYDNYSSQGNINPYTGQAGHRRNDAADPATYIELQPLPVAPLQRGISSQR